MAKYSVKNVNLNGKVFQFVNTFRNTRSGFAHDCELTIGNGRTVTATVVYYNRTWEQYEYQSVMIKAVRILIDERAEEITQRYKFENNIKRLTAKRKEEVKELIKTDDIILTYSKVKELLNNNIY